MDWEAGTLRPPMGKRSGPHDGIESLSRSTYRIYEHNNRGLVGRYTLKLAASSNGGNTEADAAAADSVLVLFAQRHLVLSLLPPGHVPRLRPIGGSLC